MDSRQESQGAAHQLFFLARAFLRPVHRTVTVPQADGRDDASPRTGSAFGRTRRVEGCEEEGSAYVRPSTSIITAFSRRSNRIFLEAQILWGQWIGVH